MKSPSAKLAIAAFLGRVALLAAGVDCLYFVFFLVVDSPVLAWVNVISVILYALAYQSARRQGLRVASLLIWLEAIPHAVLGTLMLGWESGFHYLLLMFIPAVILTTSRRQAQLFVVALLLFLGSLDFMTRSLGALAPISGQALIVLKWLNITIFVTMFSALASYFRYRIAQSEKHLQAQAMEDALTGLYNRRHFQWTVEQAISRRARLGGSLALLIMDIDHFKRINDTHGHEAGDLVLRAVAAELQAGMREMDTLARWGGEEFVLLMPEVGLAEAMTGAERLRRLIEKMPVALPDGEIYCTLSVGVTLLNKGENLSQALVRADRALYRSKAEGRNSVRSE